MTPSSIRYNPGFHSDEELIKSFVVRKHELDLILEVLREEMAPSNHHILIVGPRGVGKTTLVRRIAAEVRTNSQLASHWYPLVFAEESYEVSSPGELWLLALFHLANQTQDKRWLRAYADITNELDEIRLQERALAQLMDFADEQNTRILLIIENLNMLIGDQLDRNDAWDLRHTLLNEPRIMLLASATTRFEAIDNVGHAWYEIFSIHELKPLDDSECKKLWAFFTGEEPPDSRIRPIQILTGGNPRLVSVLAAFAKETSFRELMDNLIQLIDDHTEYFKSQLDGLASIERKVFVALLDIWDPASAQEIARVARMEVSKASALLGRLVNRGAVAVLQTGRKKYYQAAERLYNIYYLMRRRGSPSQRVHAVVVFMVQFYEGDQLIHTTAKLAEEACSLEPKRRQEHYWAYEDIVNSAPKQYRTQIVKATPKEFFFTPDIPEKVRYLARLRDDEAIVGTSEVESLILRGNELREIHQLEEAEKMYQKAIEVSEHNYKAWYGLASVYDSLKRIEEAEKAFLKALEIQPNSFGTLGRFGLFLQYRKHQFSEAESYYRRMIELEPNVSYPWTLLGELQADDLKQYEAAELSFRTAVKVEPESEDALLKLGGFLSEHLKKYDEAEQIYVKAAELHPDSAEVLTELGGLYIDIEQYDKAEPVLRKALELNPKDDYAWAHLGVVLHMTRETYEEAVSAFRMACELDPESGWAWWQLGHILFEHQNQLEEAEEALRKAIDLSPPSEMAWAELGSLLATQKKYEEAEIAFRKAIGIDPDSEGALMYFGEFLYNNKRYEEAKQIYLKVTEAYPNEVVGWEKLADVYEELEQYDKAEDTYRQIISIKPDSYRSWANLAHFLHILLDRYSEAEEAYLKAIEINPDINWVWAHLGKLLYADLGKPFEAEKAFQRAIALDSNSHWTWTEYGSFLESVERYEEAEDAYRKSIAIKPDSGRTWFLLGQYMHQHLRNLPEAESCFHKAAEFGWDLGRISLIQLYLTDLKEVDKAIKYAEQYLDESGNSSEALNEVAWLFYISGPKDCLAQAEAWARASVEQSSNDGAQAHTLISILGAQGKWDEALNLLPPLLNAAASKEEAIRDATDAVISAAAAGFARESLEMVTHSTGAVALEPLSVGLGIFLDEPSYTAKEIYEVGKDVAQRIRERQTENQN